METEPVNCKNCRAFCCGDGIKLELTDEESAFLEAGGTKMMELMPSMPFDIPHFDFKSWEERVIPANHRVYIFQGGCGYLIEEGGQLRCKIYQDSSRPKVCQAYQAGGARCTGLRKLRGFDR